jgi:hypothetical protein
MPLLSFTVLPNGVGQLHDILSCLVKFDENISLEATTNSVRSITSIPLFSASSCRLCSFESAVSIHPNPLMLASLSTPRPSLPSTNFTQTTPLAVLQMRKHGAVHYRIGSVIMCRLVLTS